MTSGFTIFSAVQTIFKRERAMVKNKLKLNRFYRELIEKENISHKEALSIYEALHREAVSLGVFNYDNILDGLEVDLRIAKAINGLTS